MATLENLIPTRPNASGLIYETIILQYDSEKLQDEAESFYLSCDNTTYCTEYSTCRTLVCSFTEAVTLKQRCKPQEASPDLLACVGTATGY